jgi:hypothetical protein
LFDLDEHSLILNKGSLLEKALWIEMEVPSSQRISLPSTHFDITKASVQHCQEALPKIPSASPMAGHLCLSLLLPFNQVERAGHFNDIFAKVRPESFLRLAVAN